MASTPRPCARGSQPIEAAAEHSAGPVVDPEVPTPAAGVDGGGALNHKPEEECHEEYSKRMTSTVM